MAGMSMAPISNRIRYGSCDWCSVVRNATATELAELDELELSGSFADTGLEVFGDAFEITQL